MTGSIHPAANTPQREGWGKRSFGWPGVLYSALVLGSYILMNDAASASSITEKYPMWMTVGEQRFAITLADIALICMLDYMDLRFPELGQWREDYPNLAGLHERLSVRPSLSETLPPAA